MHHSSLARVCLLKEMYERSIIDAITDFSINTYIRHLFSPALNLFHTLHINGIRRSHRQEW